MTDGGGDEYGDGPGGDDGYPGYTPGPEDEGGPPGDEGQVPGDYGYSGYPGGGQTGYAGPGPDDAGAMTEQGTVPGSGVSVTADDEGPTVGEPSGWMPGVWYARMADGTYTFAFSGDPGADGATGIFVQYDDAAGGFRVYVHSADGESGPEGQWFVEMPDGPPVDGSRVEIAGDDILITTHYGPSEEAEVPTSDRDTMVDPDGAGGFYVTFSVHGQAAPEEAPGPQERRVRRAGADWVWIRAQSGGRDTRLRLANDPAERDLGVSVGAGVHLGLLNGDQLTTIGEPDRALLAGLVGLRGDAAAEAYAAVTAGRADPPTVSDATCDVLEGLAAAVTFAGVAAAYATEARRPFPLLGPDLQTAILDLAYQYGPDVSRYAPLLWSAFVRGDWWAVVSELESAQGGSAPRRRAEADRVRAAFGSGLLQPGAVVRVWGLPVHHGAYRLGLRTVYGPRGFGDLYHRHGYGYGAGTDTVRSAVGGDLL